MIINACLALFSLYIYLSVKLCISIGRSSLSRLATNASKITWHNLLRRHACCWQQTYAVHVSVELSKTKRIQSL